MQFGIGFDNLSFLIKMYKILTRGIDMLNYNEQQIHDDCMLSSLKHNYVEFVAEYGFAEADRKLERLFDNTWRRNREIVWQWYDQEYLDD